MEPRLDPVAVDGGGDVRREHSAHQTVAGAEHNEHGTVQSRGYSVLESKSKLKSEPNEVRVHGRPHRMFSANWSCRPRPRPQML